MPTAEGRVLCLCSPPGMTWSEFEEGLRHWLGQGTEPSRVRLYVESNMLGAVHAFLSDHCIPAQALDLAACTRGASPAIAAICETARCHPGRDVLFAQFDCRLPDGGVDRLANALYRATAAGAVSPLSDEHALLSPFSAPRPAWLRGDCLDRWIVSLSRARLFDVPLISGRCALLRGEALAACDLAPSRADLLAQMQAAGWATVACDWAFADASRSGEGGVAPLGRAPDADFEHCAAGSPLGSIRHAFGEIAGRGPDGAPAAAVAIKPVQLHITHSWGGGLGKWVRDMCESDPTRHHLVLRSIGNWGCFGQRLALYEGAEMGHPLREWPLHYPIRSVALAHQQYREALKEIVRDFEVQVVLVSSLIGHSLDALDIERPTLVCAHDYFPFCPALVIRFDETCTQCGTDRLRACFDRNPLNRFFTQTDAGAWEAIRRRYIALMRRPGITLVAPSRSVIDNLQRLVPEFAAITAAVVENGLDMPAAPTFAPDERLTVVVLGSLAPHKGADLLFDAINEITRLADVHLIGCGEEGARFANIPGVACLPAYHHDELPALITGIRPHLGLLLSVVPETFSYTLSELWALGVPPLATRVGAFADRIDHARNGWLIDPSTHALVAALRALEADRAAIDRVRARIVGQARISCRDMAAAYDRLAPLGAAVGRPGAFPWGRPDTHERSGALLVDRQAPLRLVMADFCAYLRDKVRNTPRLSRITRAVLLRMLTACSRGLQRKR